MSLLHAICPLWSFDDRDWPDYLGSSTLLKLGDASFLVTCAHVIDNAQGRDIFFGGLDGLTPLGGEGRITRLQEGQQRATDRSDTCFLRLTDETVTAMGDRYHFITTNDLALGLHATRTTNFTFAGYPRTQARPRGRAPLRPERQLVTAGVVSDDDLIALGFSGRTHVGIRLGGGRLIQNGQPTSLPDLNGMSGGTVLMHLLESERDSAVRPRLVGLCMEIPPTRSDVFVGVRITAALEGIRDRFPELSRHIPHDPDVDIIVNHQPA